LACLWWVRIILCYFDFNLYNHSVFNNIIFFTEHHNNHTFYSSDTLFLLAVLKNLCSAKRAWSSKNLVTIINKWNGEEVRIVGKTDSSNQDSDMNAFKNIYWKMPNIFFFLNTLHLHCTVMQYIRVSQMFWKLSDRWSSANN